MLFVGEGKERREGGRGGGGKTSNTLRKLKGCIHTHTPITMNSMAAPDMGQKMHYHYKCNCQWHWRYSGGDRGQ